MSPRAERILSLSRTALAVSMMLAAGCASRAVECRLPEPVELWSEGPAHEKGGKLLARYDVDDAPVWWSEALPASPRLEAFRTAMRAAVGDVAQDALMAKAIAAGGSAGDPATKHNVEVARALAPTAVAPMRCMEAALFDAQMQRLDMVAHPSEILALILRGANSESGGKSENDKLRIYTWTVNDAGIGRVGPIREVAERDLAAGWKLAIAFHDHNFFVDRVGPAGAPDPGGVIAPSAPDAQILKAFRDDLGMAEAWISNGFDTGKWQAAALDRFE